MHYTKFLESRGPSAPRVLPYFGGAYVHDANRRFRIPLVSRARLGAPGWRRFAIRGRTASDAGPAEAPDLSALPRVRGHFVAGFVVRGGGRLEEIERLGLLPDEELPPLARVLARRWHSGDLVFETLDFDGDAEEAFRRRLEEGASAAGVKGAGASLRIAFGVALALRAAAESLVSVGVREAAGHAHAFADGGLETARAWALDLARRRRAIDAPGLDNAALRAEIALDAAHARLLSSRRLADNQLQVRFELMGERFVTVVDAQTLHVFDAGICLAGADEELTLDSLPGVIREAIESGRLVITNH